MKISRMFLKMMLCLSVMSCHRDPIWEPETGYRFLFDIDDSVLYCPTDEPELVQLLFYNPDSGKKMSETYMSPNGGSLHSFQSGTYDIVAFTMGSERTEITYTRNLNLLTAQTATLQSNPVTVINAPDHVFVGVMRNVFLPELCQADEQFALTIPMCSVCDSWLVNVTGITGLQYANSVTLYLSGQAKDVLLGDMSPQGDCLIRTGGEIDTLEGVIRFPLCTFAMGKDERIVARVEIQAQNGRVHSKDFDVTSQVRDINNIRHRIEVNLPIELEPLIQGGLDPRTDEWDENHEFMDIT